MRANTVPTLPDGFKPFAACVECKGVKCPKTGFVGDLTADELGHRLAGFADGEGCFVIRPNQKGQAHSCRFVIGLRSDDRGILEVFQSATGWGLLHEIKPNELTLKRRPGANPQTHWVVARKAECVEAAAFFRRYPLMSKKANDARIWCAAVDAWAENDWQTMAELRKELTEARKYRSVSPAEDTA